MRWIKDVCRRFIISFLTNNNTRLKTFWAATLIILVANLIIFGFGPTIESPVSETAQKYYNLYYKGQFATDAEIAGWLGSISRFFGWSWSWLRWSAWTFWFLLLGWSIIYTPIAFRDEVARGWHTAWRIILEKRTGIEEPKPKPTPEKSETVPPTPGPGLTSKIFEQARIFTREFGAAVVADMLSRKRR